MAHHSFIRATGVWLVMCLLALLANLSGCGGRADQQAGTGGHSAVAMAKPVEWRQAMLKAPPTKGGCFHAKYPDLGWTEAGCSTVPPGLEFSAAHKGGRNAPVPMGAPPEIVGGGGATDFAVLERGIANAQGYFPLVSGLAGEFEGNDLANFYSLQLNTNTFPGQVGSLSPPALCSGAADPSVCKGWVQFVWNNVMGQVFIQYWLLNFNNPCPTSPAGQSGWQTSTVSPGNCFASSSAMLAPVADISRLGSLTVVGAATPNNDVVLFGEEDTNEIFAATNPDDLLGLSSGVWNEAEFNVFGHGNGAQAVFNGAPVVYVGLSINSGGGGGQCVFQSFTGETNNLNIFSGDYCQFGPDPNVACVFPETTGTAAPTNYCNLIMISQATYGGNCGAPAGNQTGTLQAACGGQQQCNYTVDYTVIGDPEPGCAKTYDVTYFCGPTSKSLTLPAEAGFGSVANLSCP